MGFSLSSFLDFVDNMRIEQFSQGILSIFYVLLVHIIRT